MKKYDQSNNVRVCVMHDISEYIKESNQKIIGENKEVLIVTPNLLFTKENRKLNAELGLHKVNKFGEKMIRPKSKK